MTIIIKLALSALFFVCILDMPYGYYQLVRFLALLGFAILAYDANNHHLKLKMIIYISLAVLFQPIIKIPLGREVWNVVDIIIGIGLIASIYRPAKGHLVKDHDNSNSLLNSN